MASLGAAAPVKTLTELRTWNITHQRAGALKYPTDERFGLISQMRRATFSIAANLAEGCRRASAGDFARHINIAQGSVGEVDYCLLLAHDLRYATEAQVAPLRSEIDEIGAMLHSGVGSCETPSICRFRAISCQAGHD